MEENKYTIVSYEETLPTQKPKPKRPLSGTNSQNSGKYKMEVSLPSSQQGKKREIELLLLRLQEINKMIIDFDNKFDLKTLQSDGEENVSIL